MNHNHEEKSLYKEGRRHHRRPSRYATTMTTLIVLAIALLGYLTWVSMQPPSWEASCQKDHLHDSQHEVIWKCPAGDQ